MFGVQNFMRGASANLPKLPSPEANPAQKAPAQENLLAQKAKLPEIAAQNIHQQMNNAIFQ